jgi:choline monooxygenase
VTTLDFGEVACNWKLLMENFIEPYHVPFVHKTTTRQPLEDHYTVIDEHCLGSAVELERGEAEDANPVALQVTSHYLTLFPNFVIGTYQPDQMGVYLNEPIAPGRTRQQRVIYRHRDAHYSDAQIGQLESLWRSVHAEDHDMCERLQQGRQSPLAADGGLLSPCWENSVRRFQEMVADAIRHGLRAERKP